MFDFAVRKAPSAKHIGAVDQGDPKAEPNPAEELVFVPDEDIDALGLPTKGNDKGKGTNGGRFYLRSRVNKAKGKSAGKGYPNRAVKGTCFVCDKVGHRADQCPMEAKKSDAIEQ